MHQYFFSLLGLEAAISGQTLCGYWKFTRLYLSICQLVCTLLLCAVLTNQLISQHRYTSLLTKVFCLVDGMVDMYGMAMCGYFKIAQFPRVNLLI